MHCCPPVQEKSDVILPSRNSRIVVVQSHRLDWSGGESYCRSWWVWRRRRRRKKKGTRTRTRWFGAARRSLIA